MLSRRGTLLRKIVHNTKAFAIVIVAGLISRLFIGFFVNPVLYEMVAKEGDVCRCSAEAAASSAA